MKKALFTLFTFILVMELALGQTHYSLAGESIGIKIPKTHETRAGAECPPNTLFSHPVDFNVGFSSFGVITNVYDEIGADVEDVSEITFFGVFDLTPGRTFQISFYHDNAGLPGTQFATYTVFIAGTSEGLFLYGNQFPIYSYYFALPSPLDVVATDWISVVAPDVTEGWYWLSASGGNGCVYQTHQGYRCNYGDVAFCLGPGTPPPSVPISNWALLIGIGLILVLGFVRFRKMV